MSKTDRSVGGVYEEVANQYDYVGWMIGRVTMAEYSEAITESEPAKLRPAEAAPAQGIKVDPKGWDEGTKNGPDRSALLGHNFVYQETKPHGFYSSYFHQRISS